MDFILPKNKEKPEAGKLLLSDPFFQDLHFGRSIILLANHDEDGSFGFVLNKEIEITLEEITDLGGPKDVPIFLGGPVEKDRIFFIHTCPDLIPNGTLILDDLYIGGDFNAMEKAVQDGKLNKNNSRFFLGYSGWETGQLLDELEQEFWYVKSSSREEVFSINSSNDWQNVMSTMGGDFEIAAKYPQDPSLN